MDENQIRRELKTLPSFQGVFASDEFKIPRSFPASYVFNPEPRSSSGKHWVAVYIDRKKKCEYFDSFGQKPCKSILGSLRRVSSEIWYNTKCIQHEKSISCGVFCIYFLKKRNKICLLKTLDNFSKTDKIGNELELLNIS